MSTAKTMAAALALAIPSFAPSFAQAADCFILVHGSSGKNLLADTTQRLKYWNSGVKEDFTAAVIGSASLENHFGVIGWNSFDRDARPFWHPDAAGQVASQIIAIANGQGDGTVHAKPNTQCLATDRAYVVAHSQGAQVMAYINGNARDTDPNLDTVYSALDYVKNADGTYAKNPDGSYQFDSSQPSSAPFAAAMGKVSAIITIGGAINGTEGMDKICNGSLPAVKPCVTSLQTYTQYNPSSLTGIAMYRPTYNLAGYGRDWLTSGALTGDDDGIVNIASQMNCSGSPKRNLLKTLNEVSGADTVFTCNNANKRHTNNFNLASIDIKHLSQNIAPNRTFAHQMGAASVLSCGDGKNVPATIQACLSSLTLSEAP